VIGWNSSPMPSRNWLRRYISSRIECVRHCLNMLLCTLWSVNETSFALHSSSLHRGFISLTDTAAAPDLCLLLRCVRGIGDDICLMIGGSC